MHSVAVADTTPQQLARAMVGEGSDHHGNSNGEPGSLREVNGEINDGPNDDGVDRGAGPTPREVRGPGPVRLHIEGLEVMGDRGELAVRSLDLQVRGGEIVGVAGVSGNGQRELMEALVGQRAVDSGDVIVSGERRITRLAPGRSRIGSGFGAGLS